MKRIARLSGRSLEHVAQMCRAGLLPAELATSKGRRTDLPPEVGEALVAVFGARLISPAVVRQITEDPEGMREALTALELLVSLHESRPSVAA